MLSIVGESGAAMNGHEGQATQQFDRLLLDVPCSGLGVLAKRADLRWRRSADDVRHIALAQVMVLPYTSLPTTRFPQPWWLPLGLPLPESYHFSSL